MIPKCYGQQHIQCLFGGSYYLSKVAAHFNIQPCRTDLRFWSQGWSWKLLIHNSFKFILFLFETKVLLIHSSTWKVILTFINSLFTFINRPYLHRATSLVYLVRPAINHYKKEHFIHSYILNIFFFPCILTHTLDLTVGTVFR